MEYTSLTTQISESPQEKSLTEILEDPNLKLTSDQIDTLINLTYGDQFLLDLKDIKDDNNASNNFFYEVVGMLYKYGYAKTYDFLLKLSEKEDLVVNGKLVFESFAFEKEQMKYLGEIERMRDKIERQTQGLYPCKNCGSRDTSDENVQERSGDEAPTYYVICNSCGKRSRV